ncbi:MAG: LysM peptidoglycan-binding domain-containing protein [Chloroflexi bacterium]|nr:LysM peptidoglycan-binding domain-containing protein [Chloroflexota bacterium]
MNQNNYRQSLDSANRLPIIIALVVGIALVAFVLVIMVIISAANNDKARVLALQDKQKVALADATIAALESRSNATAIAIAEKEATLQQREAGLASTIRAKEEDDANAAAVVANLKQEQQLEAAKRFNATAVAQTATKAKSEPIRAVPTTRATPNPSGEAKRPVWYEVKVGDNLSQVAARYNTSVRAIAEANRNAVTLGYALYKILIENPESYNPTIHVGDRLVIPVGRQEFKGFGIIWNNSNPDEWQRLQKDYGLTLTELLGYNGIASVTELRTGDPLLVPKK